MVFKNIAEQTYLRKVKLTVNDCDVDSALIKNPVLKNGNWDFNLALLDALKLPAGNLSEAAG